MINREHVKHIAELARLALSEKEVEMFTGQLDSVLQYSDQLNKVDTADVEPTSFVSPERDPLRDDVIQPSLPREKLLQNGPNVKKGHFAVPKVINQ
ncbi:MAG: Asp-tRNA(Asn)/Glu-tRNA(Gln) amidotransferase subunit GatC [Chitinivibrionales bacterium]